jgi:hypothetical protein
MGPAPFGRVRRVFMIFLPLPTDQRENARFARQSQGDKIPARGAQVK